MKTLDVSKVLHCLLSCEQKPYCEKFSACVGARNCLLPIENCEQLDKCRRIKQIIKQVLKCENLTEKEGDY